MTKSGSNPTTAPSQQPGPHSAPAAESSQAADLASEHPSAATAPAEVSCEPSEHREVSTRTRLLEAAGPVFAEHGFDGATVREICSSAGVNVASVGYYFGDKLGLYREVIREIRESRERRFPSPDSDHGDARHMLYQHVRTLLSRMLSCDESGWETQLLTREMHRPTPVFESMVHEFFRPQFDRLVETIRELTGTQAAKHQLEQLALSVVAQCIYYRIGSGIIQVLIPEDELKKHFDIDSLSRHITAVMLAATQSGGDSNSVAPNYFDDSDPWRTQH